jgi:tetratricopeptide repeat protein
MLLRLMGSLLLAAKIAEGAGNPLIAPAPFQATLDQLRNGQFRRAREASQTLEKAFPSHPLAPLLSAEANWNLIFCQTGHINSREIWNEAEQKTSSFDAELFAAVERAIRTSQAMRRQRETVALGFFYEGLAHGVLARLYTLRGQGLKAASEGKQMRASLLNALSNDPTLEPDADAGLGIYNYYADVLSPIVKLFRFILLIPGGDRERGLAQLLKASQSATVLLTESKYELAKILAVRENRPADALALFRVLVDKYPGNAIFSVSAAIQAERIGRKDLAADYARQAITSSRQMDDVCRARIEPAAEQQLDRITGK